MVVGELGKGDRPCELLGGPRVVRWDQARRSRVRT